MGLGSSYLVLKHPSLRPNHDQSRRISRVSIATGLSSHIWCKEITTPKWYPQNGSFKGKSWLTIGFEGTYFSENSKLFNEMCLGYILIPVDIHKHSGYIYNYIYKQSANECAWEAPWNLRIGQTVRPWIHPLWRIESGLISCGSHITLDNIQSSILTLHYIMIIYYFRWLRESPTCPLPQPRHPQSRSRPAARRASAECRALGSRQGSPVAHGVASLEAPNGPLLVVR